MDWGTEILISMLDKPEYQKRRLIDQRLDAALKYAGKLQSEIKKTEV